MRITSGQYKNRKLDVPAGDSVRPTSDRARQALFNMLNHSNWASDFTFENAHVLDIFCGSGALGLEALSNDAQSCTFIDKDTKSVIKNSELLPRNDVAIIKSDALKYRAKKAEPFTLVFMDPPYRQNLVQPTLDHLINMNCIADQALIIIEAEKELKLDNGLEVLDTRAQGQSRLHILRYHAAV